MHERGIVSTLHMTNWSIFLILMQSAERHWDCKFQSVSVSWPLTYPFDRVGTLQCKRFCECMFLSHIENIDEYFHFLSARQDSVLPLATPITGLNGKKITDLHIPNGMLILITIQACNTSPEIWGPDSYEWKPERWLKPLPESVTAARIPGIYSNLWV